MYTIPSGLTYNWGGYCGIPGGIPNRTNIYTTLTSSATTAQVNSAIQNCPNGQVVYLSAGTYSLGSLTFNNKTGVTLRGAGPGVTNVNMSGSIASDGPDYADGTGITISSGYAKDSMAIVLASAPSANFSAGNVICIAEDRNENKWATGVGVYTRVGFPSGSTVYGLNQNRCFRFMVRITSVVGNTVNLAAPIPLSFTSTNIKAHPPGGATSPVLCGIENMTLNAQNNVDTPVRFYSADRCWLKDVELKNVPGSDIGMVRFHQSTQCEINRCYIHDATGFPSQADGYASAFNYGASNCLIINTVTYRVADLCETCGAAGCAYINNYCYKHNRASDYSRGVTLDHGPHGFMNLSEGNVLCNVCNDGYHGSTSHCFMFRNHINGENMNQPKIVNLCRGAYYNSLVGNVLGASSLPNPTYYEAPLNPSTDSAIYFLGFPTADSTGLGGYTSVAWTNWGKSTSQLDPDVKATLLRQANYDYFNDATIYSDADHVIQNSLFYSSKPAYFGTLTWPPIGPDVSGMINNNPAKWRWGQYQVSGLLSDMFADSPAESGPHREHLVELTVDVDAQDYLSVDYPKARAVAGTSVTYKVHANPRGTFTGNITLDVTGLPTNATDSYDVNPITQSGSATVTITTTGVTAGSYNMNITGTSAGGDVKSIRVILEVVAAADFDLKVPVRRIRVKKGDNAVFTIEADSLSGFTSDIDLATVSAPAGSTVAFGDSTLAYNGTTTMTVGTASVNAGTYQFDITGD